MTEKQHNREAAIVRSQHHLCYQFLLLFVLKQMIKKIITIFQFCWIIVWNCTFSAIIEFKLAFDDEQFLVKSEVHFGLTNIQWIKSKINFKYIYVKTVYASESWNSLLSAHKQKNVHFYTLHHRIVFIHWNLTFFHFFDKLNSLGISSDHFRTKMRLCLLVFLIVSFETSMFDI